MTRAFLRRFPPPYFTRPPTTARVLSGTTACPARFTAAVFASHGFLNRVRVVGAAAADGWGGGGGPGPVLPRAARRRGAPLGLGRLAAPGQGAPGAPVRGARGVRPHRRRGGGQYRGGAGEERGEEEAGARPAGVEADPVRLQEDPQHNHAQRPHRHLWSSDIPVLKEVEALTEPAVFNMVRFVVAAIPFLPFAFRAFGDRHVRNAGLELGVWVSLAYLTQAIGLLSSDAGRASFIAAFTVIVVPLIDGLLGASIPKLTWFGAIVSLLGIGLLECGGSPPCDGDVLNFFSAVFFGIHMLRTEQISRSTDKKKFLALLSFEVFVVAFSSVLWFIFKDGYVDTGESSFESWTFGMLWDTAASFPWIPALYTGVLSTVLCMWAEMVAMGDVSATETAIVYGLEPVWGAAFAWFLLSERWDNAEWIGAALVLCGSLTVQLFGSAPKKSKKVQNRKSNSLETPVKRQEYLSLSLIPVDSRKIAGRQLERKDKTF
ncbi:unnamed protein product [Urochloa decumbens]|uniref:EamA domain-containing protein n=1 Tax=Urochloa decumbens TaxID=240449 RepID=A0ABC8X5M4_9POAL